MKLNVVVTMMYVCLASVSVYAQETFCAICSREAWAGDSAALNKFMSGCGVVDTVGYDSLNMPTDKNPVFKKVTMKLNSGKVLFTDDIYLVAETMPEFEGGEKAIIEYFKSHMKYPPIAREKKKSGTVFIQFIIEKDGSVSHTQVKRPIDSDLDAEALRVIRELPKWKPGMSKGKPVRVQMSLPVTFKLN